MQPDAREALQLLANLGQIVESTGARGAQRGGDEERHQALQLVLLHGLVDRLAAQTGVLVGLQNAQLHKADHRRLLHAAVRLLGAVGHQLGQQVALLHERMLGLEPLQGLRPGSQHRDQHALRGGSLGIQTIDHISHGRTSSNSKHFIWVISYYVS